MIEIVNRIRTFFLAELWRSDLQELSPARRYSYTILRLLFVLVRDFSGGELNLRAMSLVYTTLLSMVPLLAVSFSVLKAFGVHNQIEPVLMNFVEPLGEEGKDIVVSVLGFVENMKVGVLGSVGMALLIYTVISLIQKIEHAFNFVWHTKGTRSLSRRFSDYLSVILVGPVLVFSAIGMTASVMNTTLVQKIIAIEPFGSVVVFAGKLIPYLFIIAAFAFVYMFVPNTRVRFKSALVGAMVGGILWQTTGVVFASFAAMSTEMSGRYTAIYSGFAILILFMIWIYLSWLILLFGAQIAYFHQNPQQLRLRTGRMVLSNRLKERVALLIMTLVADNYLGDRPPWTLDSLVHRLKLPGDAIGEILETLVRHGFIIETAGDHIGYVPAHDPERLSVERFLQTLRSAGEDGFIIDQAALSLPPLDAALQRIEQGVGTALDGNTIKDLTPQGAGSQTKD